MKLSSPTPHAPDPRLEPLRFVSVALLGVLGSIGFTMSIFISNRAFEGTGLLGAARLAASVLAAGLGLVIGQLGHAVPADH